MYKTPILLAVAMISLAPIFSAAAHGQESPHSRTWRPTPYIQNAAPKPQYPVTGSAEAHRVQTRYPQSHYPQTRYPVTRSNFTEPCNQCESGRQTNASACCSSCGQRGNCGANGQCGQCSSAGCGATCGSGCGSSCGSACEAASEDCGVEMCDCGGRCGGGCGRCNPVVGFTGQWLILTRDTDFRTPNVIGGPEAFGFNNLDFDYDSGYRLNGFFTLGNWDITGAYTRFDNWSSTAFGTLTNGVAFDGGAAWAGGNFINGTTFYSPLAAAAAVDQNGGPTETDEADGLGPNANFPADFPPFFFMHYQSELDMAEIVFKRNDMSHWYKIGMGYSHVELDEQALVALDGLFRADDVAGPTGGLSHAALTDPAGGNLQFLGGAPDGFDDESGVAGAGPDRIVLFHQASTANRLNGFLFTFDALFYDGPRLVLDGFLKAGVFGNHVQGRVTERYQGRINDNSVYGRTFFDEKNVVAFAGGAGVGGAVKLTDSVLVRLGYEAIFLNGVALAPDQMRGLRGGVYEVVGDGNLVAHGGRLGFELRY